MNDIQLDLLVQKLQKKKREKLLFTYFIFWGKNSHSRQGGYVYDANQMTWSSVYGPNGLYPIHLANVRDATPELTKKALPNVEKMLKIPEKPTTYSILVLILNIIGLYTFIKLIHDNHGSASKPTASVPLRNVLTPLLTKHIENNTLLTPTPEQQYKHLLTKHTGTPDEIDFTIFGNQTILANNTLIPLFKTYITNPSDANLTKILTIADNNDLFDKNNSYSLKPIPWYRSIF